MAGIHRTGLGKCFMTHTMNPEYGPYQYTVTLKSRKILDTAWPPNFQHLLTGVIALICYQRSPPWFLLQEFIFPPTLCYTCLWIKTKHIYVSGPHATLSAHILVLDTLGITRHTASLGDYDLDVEEFFDICNKTVDSLQEFPKEHLVLLCQRHRPPYSGNKLI